MEKYTAGFSGTLTLKEYPSEQSANALFTCMRNIRFLKDILKRKKIYPRYYKEDIEYLHLPGLSGIAYPMKCFCDIFLNKLEKHMDKYGEYGIALTKEWGLTNKIQPIQYINENSFLYTSIQKLYENRHDPNNKLEYGLKITDKDIKYIIISKEEEREPFIDFILKECRFSRKEKYNLISKLIIFNEMKGDW